MTRRTTQSGRATDMPTKFSDAQLRRIRDDFDYFCTVVLGRKLDPRQLEVFTCKKPTRVWIAGRGAGKTVCTTAFVLWRSIREAKHVAVWVASAEEQAGVGSEILGDYLDEGPLAAYV